VTLVAISALLEADSNRFKTEYDSQSNSMNSPHLLPPDILESLKTSLAGIEAVSNNRTDLERVVFAKYLDILRRTRFVDNRGTGSPYNVSKPAEKDTSEHGQARRIFELLRNLVRTSWRERSSVLVLRSGVFFYNGNSPI
jgi:hypothetical protein